MIWISRSFIFILLFEFFSFFASKFGLLLFNDSPGAYSRIYLGYEWRTEKELWGAWHKVKSESDRHQKSCFDVTYKSNDVGARDSIDYLSLSTHNNVAIIGDSFVEGFHVDADKSIGRQIELKNDNYQVYEFGQAGFNYFNYKEIYQKYSLNNFDHVFLIIDLYL